MMCDHHPQTGQNQGYNLTSERPTLETRINEWGPGLCSVMEPDWKV
jgi:hypothetical protein